MKNLQWGYAPKRKAYILMEDLCEEIFHCNESLKHELVDEKTKVQAESQLYTEMRAETDLDGSHIQCAINLLKQW
jgi:hypothetical protein